MDAIAPALPDGEVEAVYLPLAALIRAQLGQQAPPFLIGIAGSVAAGKSTVAQLLRGLLTVWGRVPTVQVLSTDGFIYPTAVLQARRLMHRKGFPESYDTTTFFNLIRGVRAGEAHEAPLYSHQTYDRLPETLPIHRPDVLIVEGVNVLQATPEQADGVRPFLDLSLYVDASEDDLFAWFMQRFQRLLEAARRDPLAYLHPLTTLPPAEAEARATHIWNTINLPNLRQHIRPTRAAAHLVLEKSSTHRVHRVALHTRSLGHLNV